MDKETQPIQPPAPPEPTKPKILPRRERVKPTFTSLRKRALPPATVIKPPEIVDPSLGENDVRAQVIVKLTTRYGVSFMNDDSEVMGAALDPANRGHIAKVMETSFNRMCAFVIRGFSQLMEGRFQEIEARQKELVKADPKTARMVPARQQLAGPVIELEEEGKPPLPVRPGAGFVPPLALPPIRA